MFRLASDIVLAQPLQTSALLTIVSFLNNKLRLFLSLEETIFDTNHFIGKWDYMTQKEEINSSL